MGFQVLSRIFYFLTDHKNCLQNVIFIIMIFVKSKNNLNWFSIRTGKKKLFFEKAGSVRGARFHYKQLDTCQNDNNKPST